MSAISKEEYLKKYLQPSQTVKKKKKKQNVKQTGIRILDETVQVQPKFIEKTEEEDEGTLVLSSLKIFEVILNR